MSSKRYIKFSVWFALFPVRTINKGWVWLKFVEKMTDERPEVYLGLLPEHSYTAY
jgi:hypothetical protein